MTVEQMALDERKFLHDLSNHLVVAQGMSSFVLRTLKDQKPVEAKDVERLEKAIEAINRMTNLLKERRTVLHAQSGKPTI